MPERRAFLPGAILAAGCLLLVQGGRQESMPLRGPLATLPDSLLGLRGDDVPISPEEQRVAGMSTYLLRTFSRPDSQVAFSVYVGYYESQTQGKAIHSPKNCLPGAGWEVVSSSETSLPAGGTTYPVNRYIISREGLRALVYYWYQGRGRVSANEYLVKWELLRDKAVERRSEESLVRVVVPVYETEAVADSIARAVAIRMIPAVFERLPVPPTS